MTRRLQATCLVLALSACSSPGSASPSATASPPPTLTSEQLAVIDVGRNATQVAVGSGSAWVGNSGDGTLSQIDASRNRVVRTIPIGSTESLRALGCAPGTVHSAPDGSYAVRRCDVPAAVIVATGSLWVTKDDEHALLRMDPGNLRVVAKIPLGIRPFLMAAGMGSIWVTDYENSAITRVDISSNTVVKTFRGFTGGPSGIAVGAGAVWVANRSANVVTRIDPSINAVAAVIPVGSSPLAIAAGDAVFVKEEYGQSVARIDPATNTVVARIMVGPKEGRDGVDSIALDGEHGWVTGMRLQEFDTRTNSVVRTLAQNACTVSLDGAGGLWITDVAGRVVHLRPPP
jgi:YVTN family beta-propeller protein